MAFPFPIGEERSPTVLSPERTPETLRALFVPEVTGRQVVDGGIVEGVQNVVRVQAGDGVAHPVSSCAPLQALRGCPKRQHGETMGLGCMGTGNERGGGGQHPGAQNQAKRYCGSVEEGPVTRAASTGASPTEPVGLTVSPEPPLVAKDSAMHF
jgi:hypothetical protein